MMSQLDTVLDSWHAAHAAGCRQVDRQRVLGFPPALLPGRSALLYATLAALGARGKLAGSILPEVQALRDKGVIDPHAAISQLNVGVLAAIEVIRPHLSNVANLVEAMRERALAAAAQRTHENAPMLGLPNALRAAAGQTARIEVQCVDADRLLIHASGIGMTRVIVQPAPIQMLSLTMHAGELMAYAENDAGSCKLVRAMEVGCPERCPPVERHFTRAAFSSGRHPEAAGSRRNANHEMG